MGNKEAAATGAVFLADRKVLTFLFSVICNYAS